jgi:predicted nucleic acid-binding protein
MRVCCDTSFLFSFYGRDTLTPAATGAARALKEAPVLSPFNEYEFENAVRRARHRRLIGDEQAAAMLEDFAADMAAGTLETGAVSLAAVLGQARRISAKHTPAGGHRAFDILHVAAAVAMEADAFLSFDLNQRELAKAEGLKLLPRAMPKPQGGA